jgi:polyisoprenoid-binding protein YceI
MATYAIDVAHSDIRFSARHMVFAKVRGHFTRWTATLVVDDGDPARSSVTASIETTSIDTCDAQRDAHLLSADFLDAERFPKIEYKSLKVERTGDKKFKVTGDLTIRGTSKEVSLDVEELGRGSDAWGHDRRAFVAKARLERADFGLKWNLALEAGGVLVSERVDVEIGVQAIQAKPA